MNDSKILNSSRHEYIGEVDIANEEILRHGALFGRLERWSNGYMVIANRSVVGRLEERFVEGMNSTFQCFHHHFVVGRVSKGRIPPSNRVCHNRIIRIPRR